VNYTSNRKPQLTFQTITKHLLAHCVSNYKNKIDNSVRNDKVDAQALHEIRGKNK